MVNKAGFFSRSAKDLESDLNAASDQERIRKDLVMVCNIPLFVKCSICQEVMQEAMITACQHCYCKKCIESWNESSTGRGCPECRREVKPLTPARLLRQAIDELKIRCSEEGCGEIVSVGAIEAHHKECEKRTSDCQRGCGALLQNRDKATHQCAQVLAEKLESQRRAIIKKDREIEALNQKITALKEHVDFKINGVESLWQELEDRDRQTKDAYEEMIELIETLQLEGSRLESHFVQNTRARQIKLKDEFLQRLRLRTIQLEEILRRNREMLDIEGTQNNNYNCLQME